MVDRGGYWLAAAALSLALTGCGYVGEPLPPALKIPEAVSDLRALQRGDRVLVDFTIPPLTTEGLEVASIREVELRAGPGAEPPFQIDRWAAGATQIPVDASHAGPVQASVPVDEWAGQEIFLAVRAEGPSGRRSGWSNIAVVRVIDPLPAPENVKAQATADGIELTWTGKGNFRVFRKSGEDNEFRRLAVVDRLSFVDGSAEFGKTYEYAVQSAAKAGSSEAESDPSHTVSITAEDRFPPSVPTAMKALPGTNTIELAWERSPEGDVAGYLVYRADGDGAFARLGDRSEAPSFSDRTIEHGKRYRYRVSAVDVKGNESAPSAPFEITAP